jgi:hypothetical protein
MSLVTPCPVRMTRPRLKAHLQTVLVVLLLDNPPGNAHCCHTENSVCSTPQSRAVDNQNTSSFVEDLGGESCVVERTSVDIERFLLSVLDQEGTNIPAAGSVSVGSCTGTVTDLVTGCTGADAGGYIGAVIGVVG